MHIAFTYKTLHMKQYEIKLKIDGFLAHLSLTFKKNCSMYRNIFLEIVICGETVGCKIPTKYPNLKSVFIH